MRKITLSVVLIMLCLSLPYTSFPIEVFAISEQDLYQVTPAFDRIDNPAPQKPSYPGPPKRSIPEKTANEIAKEENSEVINTLLHSGKKSGVDAIAEKYKISQEQAKKKVLNAMRFFEQYYSEQSWIDGMLYYPELGLKIAKDAGTAATMTLAKV